MADKSNEPENITPPSLGSFLVERRAEQFSFLSSLVRTNSENPPGETVAMAEKLTQLLNDMEFSVEAHPVDADAAAAQSRGAFENLVVSVPFGDESSAGPTIVLAAHMDTPPAGADWTRDPQGAEIDDGRMYGRGVSDGKGDLAAYVYALAALRECAAGLVGRVDIQVTFDGATGGDLGVKSLLDSGDQAPNFAIVPGAARAIGSTVTGVLDLDVVIKGASAPAGVPQAGADALEAAASVLAALYKYRDGLRGQKSEVEGIGSPTLVVTEIRGGDGALTVPDRVTLLVDRRLLPEEDAAVVENGLTNIIGRAVAAVSGVVGRVRRRRLLPAVLPGDAVAPLLDALSRAGKQVEDRRPAVYGAAFETLARDFAAAGVPVVLYGAGRVGGGRDGGGGHMATRADEALELDDLRVATEVLAVALADLLRPVKGD
jgi:succinyl-diaminopimelate desuccinylase